MKVNFISGKDGSSISSVTLGESSETGDKGAGKAMSYALKFALLQSFLIPTEEQKDPDEHSVVFSKPEGFNFERDKQLIVSCLKDLNVKLTAEQAVNLKNYLVQTCQDRSHISVIVTQFLNSNLFKEPIL